MSLSAVVNRLWNNSLTKSGVVVGEAWAAYGAVKFFETVAGVSVPGVADAAFGSALWFGSSVHMGRNSSYLEMGANIALKTAAVAYMATGGLDAIIWATPLFKSEIQYVATWLNTAYHSIPLFPSGWIPSVPDWLKPYVPSIPGWLNLPTSIDITPLRTGSFFLAALKVLSGYGPLRLIADGARGIGNAISYGYDRISALPNWAKVGLATGVVAAGAVYFAPAYVAVGLLALNQVIPWSAISAAATYTLANPGKAAAITGAGAFALGALTYQYGRRILNWTGNAKWVAAGSIGLALGLNYFEAFPQIADQISSISTSASTFLKNNAWNLSVAAGAIAHYWGSHRFIQDEWGRLLNKAAAFFAGSYATMQTGLAPAVMKAAGAPASIYNALWVKAAGAGALFSLVTAAPDFLYNSRPGAAVRRGTSATLGYAGQAGQAVWSRRGNFGVRAAAAVAGTLIFYYASKYGFNFLGEIYKMSDPSTNPAQHDFGRLLVDKQGALAHLTTSGLVCWGLNRIENTYERLGLKALTAVLGYGWGAKRFYS